GLMLTYAAVHRMMLNAPAMALPLTPDGRAMWQSWYDSWNAYVHDWGSQPGRGARAKMPRYLARFALIRARMTGAERVSAEDIRYASMLVDYYTAMADRALGGLTRAPSNVRSDGRAFSKVQAAILRFLADSRRA